VLKEYSSLISELREKLDTCSSQHDLANIKSHYLGKKGIISNEFLKLRTALPEKRKLLGGKLNVLKNEAQKLILNKVSELSAQEDFNEKIDVKYENIPKLCKKLKVKKNLINPICLS